MTQTGKPETRFSPYAGLPLPQPSWDNYKFWEYCKAHELRLQKCSGCGELRYYPRPACPECHSMKFEWTKVSGKGTVYSYTIAHHPVLPFFADKVPLPVGVIKLDEGEVYMVGRLMDVDPDDVKIGMPVQVMFEDVAEDITLPQWRKAEG